MAKLSAIEISVAQGVMEAVEKDVGPPMDIATPDILEGLNTGKVIDCWHVFQPYADVPSHIMLRSNISRMNQNSVTTIVWFLDDAACNFSGQVQGLCRYH